MAADASVSLRALFTLFLKIGLSFGAGTGMSAVLQKELVHKRHAIGRGEFMVLYGLARLVPSGSMSALAVAIGYRYQRWAGTVVALLAMIGPGFSLMLVLTIAYTLLADSPLMRVLGTTLVPAAVALVVVSTFRLGTEFFTFSRLQILGRLVRVPSVELWLVLGGAVSVLAFGAQPALILVGGGLIGAVLIRPGGAE